MTNRNHKVFVSLMLMVCFAGAGMFDARLAHAKPTAKTISALVKQSDRMRGCKRLWQQKTVTIRGKTRTLTFRACAPVNR